ncbi:MAG TPA: hypothetical protein VFA65_21935 [Bryobacteraceae bacterium]|nr:hypothetical protein [Bryobacteraceae bacterium]
MSHIPLEDGMCDPEQHVAWESHFNGIMGTKSIVSDQGVPKPSDATATAFTTIDVFPVKTEADVSAYEGMPISKFEAAVKAAIAKNVDTN